MGRPLANAGFLRALLQSNTFAAYDFFLPDAAYVERWQRAVARLVPEAQGRVRALPLLALSGELQRHTYDVFHQGDFTYFLPHLGALRQARGGQPFCLTGITHSLDNLHARLLEC